MHTTVTCNNVRASGPSDTFRLILNVDRPIFTTIEFYRFKSPRPKVSINYFGFIALRLELYMIPDI